MNLPSRPVLPASGTAEWLRDVWDRLPDELRTRASAEPLLRFADLLGATPATAEALARAIELDGRPDLGLPDPGTPAGRHALTHSPCATLLLDTGPLTPHLSPAARALALRLVRFHHPPSLETLACTLPHPQDAAPALLELRELHWVLSRHAHTLAGTDPPRTWHLRPDVAYALERSAATAEAADACHAVATTLVLQQEAVAARLELDEALPLDDEAGRVWRDNAHALLLALDGRPLTDAALDARLRTCVVLHAFRAQDSALLDLARRATPSAPHDAPPATHRAWASMQRALAVVAAATGPLDAALSHLDDADRHAIAAGCEPGVVRSACIRSVVHRTAGQAAEARLALRRARDVVDRLPATARDERARVACLDALLVHTFEGHDAARGRWRDALHRVREAALPTLEGFVLLQLGNLAWRDADPVRAAALLRDAAARQREVGDARGLATTLTGIATVLLDAGALEAAAVAAQDAVDAHESCGQRLPTSVAHLLRARIALEARTFEAAEDALLRASGAVPPGTPSRWGSAVAGTDALVGVARGDRGRAARALDSLRAHLDGANPELRAEAYLIDAWVGGREASDAEGALAIPAPTGGDAYSVAAQRLGRLLMNPADVEEVASLFRSDPGRATAFTSARVRFWLARVTDTMKPAVARAFWCAALDPDGDHLVLEDTAMRVPSGASFVDLGNRPLPLRLLRALVAAHRTSTSSTPDDVGAVPDASLMTIGWPGERMAASSASMRLQRAMSDLRSAGLGDALQRTSGGYRIAPHVKVLTLPSSFFDWWSHAARPLAQELP